MTTMLPAVKGDVGERSGGRKGRDCVFPVDILRFSRRIDGWATAVEC